MIRYRVAMICGAAIAACAAIGAWAGRQIERLTR